MIDLKGVKILTLESRANYQRQLCIVPPRTRIPEHSHKNVRTNIIFLSGHAVFIKGERSIDLSAPQDSGRAFIIDPGELHGCYTLGQDFVFMTEQYWLNNERVKSLHLNWEGDPINEEHEKDLRIERAVIENR